MINYKKFLDKSFRHMISDIFEEVQTHGITGEDNHFLLTFDTNYPGVRLSPFLKEKHPEQLTIMLQYQFEDFLFQRQDNVYKSALSVTLFFDGKPQALPIPVGSILSISDPFEDFAIQFDPLPSEAGAGGLSSAAAEASAESSPEKSEEKAKVIDFSSLRAGK